MTIDAKPPPCALRIGETLRGSGRRSIPTALTIALRQAIAADGRGDT